MSQSGYFLLRARSPKAAATILGASALESWSLLDQNTTLDELIAKEPRSRPGIVLGIPTYFPSTSAELEGYRLKLIDALPLAALAKLHDDARGVFVFDPMAVEEHGAETYDEVIAACAEYGGFWFDPARPATEQTLELEERESIAITPDLLDELLGSAPAKKPRSRKKPAKKPRSKKQPSKKPRSKKQPSKKPRSKKQPAKKQPAKKRPAKKRPARRA